MKQKSWLVFVFVLFILFCFYPYEFYSTYLLFIVPEQQTYFTAGLIVIAGFIFVLNKRNTQIPSTLIIVAVVQSLGFILVALVQGGLGSVSAPLLRIVLAVLLVSIINRSGEGLVGFYKKYNIWILIMAIMGTMTWALVTFVGFQPLFPFIERAGGLTMYNYGLTFTKSDVINIGMIRYAGFFDEPGAMAYWGLYAILINKLFIKNNVVELLLIIGLLFTFSLGFYFQILFFLLFFSLGAGGKRSWFVVAAVSFLVFIAIAKISPDSVVYEKSIGRITETITESQESGSVFAAGNRAEYAENAKQLFLDNPIFGTSAITSETGNNVYENLANYGIFGCLFILFPYLYLLILSLKNKDYELLKCSIIIFLGFTHRPFHSALLYYFIMYSIILMYLNGRKSHRIPNNVRT